MKTPAQKNRGGRPRKTAPRAGDRVALGLRVTAKMKSALDAAAKQSGRSQSQEAELRLERSFDRQSLLQEVLATKFGDVVASRLLEIGAVMHGAGTWVGAMENLDDRWEGWLSDPFAYQQAWEGVVYLFNADRPPGESRFPSGRTDAYGVDLAERAARAGVEFAKTVLAARETRSQTK